MEDYEQFCTNQFARIKGEVIHSGLLSAEPAVSVIRFHGVAVLSPLITLQRREEMQQYRQKAVELEMKRNGSKKKTLLNRVQEILETVQVKQTPITTHLSNVENETDEQTTDSKIMNGFAILPSVLNLPMLSAQNEPTKIEKILDSTPITRKSKPGFVESNSAKESKDVLPFKQTNSPVTSSEASYGQPVSESDNPPSAKDAPDPYVMSLQNLLKKSREYIEREQSRRNLKNVSKTSSNESHSDKENDTIKISDSVKEKARLLNRSRSCSPLMADKPTLNKSNSLLQAASIQIPSMSSASLTSLSNVDIPLKPGTLLGVDSESDEELKNSCTIEYESSIVKSLTGSYAKLPSPELSLSPKMHRRRPRTSSAGHIIINKPINAYDLSPNDKGKTVDMVFHRRSEKTCLSDPVPKIEGHPSGPCSSKDNLLNTSNCYISPKGSSTVSMTSCEHKAHDTTPETDGHQAIFCRGQPVYDICSPTENQLSPPVNLPDSTQKGSKPNMELSKHNSPVELNKSYDVETPSPMLVQSHNVNQGTDIPNVSCNRDCLSGGNFDAQIKRRLELDLDSTQKEFFTPLSKTEEEKRRLHEQKNVIASVPIISNEESLSSIQEGDHLRKKMLAFEEMRKKLEEQHAYQLSLLIAEQEKEQRRLQKEFEEEERRLRLKDNEIPEVIEICTVKPEWRNRSGSLPDMAPCQVETYYSSSPNTTVGSVSCISQHSYASRNESSFGQWGPTTSGTQRMSAPRSLGKSRTRWSQVYSPAMQRKLNKVSALAKGFLTRRLMQTEKLRNLKQTVKDTAEFLRTFQTEVPLSRGIVSAQDASLHERVHAQLRAALYEIHDIFFAMDAADRMHILIHDRELRHEKLIRQMVKTTNLIAHKRITVKEKLKSPRDRVTLSSATQKSLDRKKSTRAVNVGMSKKVQHKPKALETRILQPNQGQNSLINKLLCRQGSICNKNPKKEAKCCDNLRRQHSLG
ncbi:centriolar coiled-coil protein of 110 kDa isoform X3 [Bombina bombina]|nr:centriolar coiled-coil protein of 110 kDa isoform X3 [Bombina bombina]